MASNPYEQFLIPSDSNQQTAVATDQGGAVGPSGEQLNLPPNTGAENIAGGIPAAVTDNPYSQFLQSQQQQQALPQSDPNDLTSNYTQSVPQATPQDNTKDNPYAQFLQPTPTPIHVQEQTGPVINLPALPPKEQTVFDQALNQYPQLQKAGAVGLISTETPDGENKLESWQPKDEGTKDRPRPKELPNEKLGVQIFSKDTTPEDVAADIVSHSLVKTDPTLKATYDQFASSLTPSQIDFLKGDYEHDVKQGEDRPFDQWMQTVGIPSAFRGYAFSQYSPVDQDNFGYTTQQQQLLGSVKPYLQQPLPSQQKPVDISSLPPEQQPSIPEFRQAPPMGAMEQAGRFFSGLMGPTQAQRFEDAAPVRMPDGSIQYQYKPFGNRLEQEQGVFTPFAKIEKYEPNASDSAMVSAGKAAFNTAAGLEESFLSPAGVLLPGLGGVGGRVVSGLFAGQMLANIPEQFNQMMHGKTTQEQIEGGLGVLTSLGFGVMAGKHAIVGEKPPELNPSNNPSVNQKEAEINAKANAQMPHPLDNLAKKWEILRKELIDIVQQAQDLPEDHPDRAKLRDRATKISQQMADLRDGKNVEIETPSAEPQGDERFAPKPTEITKGAQDILDLINTGTDPNSLSRTTLLEAAAQNGVRIPEGATNAQIVEALRQHQTELKNAVQVKTTGEVGVRNAPAVGEGVGEQNKPEETTTQGEKPKEEVAPNTLSEEESKDPIAKLNKSTPQKDGTNLFEPATQEEIDAQKQNPVFILADKLAGIFGKKVVLYRSKPGRQINGAVNRGMKGYIFLNVDGTRPHLFTAGHELWHSIEVNAPKLYQSLRKELDALVKDRAGLEAKYRPAGYKPERYVDEHIGDLLGDALQDPDFWNKLADRNPEAFKSLAEKTIDWLNGVIEKLKGWAMGGGEYTRDLERARNMLADGLNNFAKGKDEPVVYPPETPSETFYQQEAERKPDKDGFYSQLQRTLSDKMPNKASVEQIRAIIDPAKGSGVKPDEIKWSNLEGFLEGKKNVTKQEVLDYLKNEGAVKFEEKIIGDRTLPVSEIRKMVDAGDRIDVFDQKHNRYVSYDELAYYGDDEKLAIKQDTNTKFSQWTIPNGENYREVMLVHPNAEPWSGFPSAHAYGPVSDPINSQRVAHMRLDERPDSEGRNGLFIEEIQSDRHQKGRERGYKENLPQENFTTWAGTRGLNKEQIEKEYENNSELFQQWQRDQKDALKDASKIPDAPFRKDWPIQMFKRALRDAIASGKEWVGWTKGDTQAERYDLSKQVDEVQWSPIGKKLWVREKGGDAIHLREVASDVTPDKLADYIGKEAAQKIVDAPYKGGVRTLSGVDLKVGGEGMKGFYDQILPKEIGKYVKKWGAKVEEGSTDGTYYNIFDPKGKKIETQDTREAALASAKEHGEGYTVEPSKDGQTPIWKVEITPEMRESVTKEGQTMFQQERPTEEEASKKREEIDNQYQAAPIRKTKRTIVNTFKRSPAKEAISFMRDAGDNAANVYAKQQTNEIKNDVKREFKGQSSKAEEALSKVIESKGDIKALDAMRQKLNASTDASPKWKKKALDAIDFAERNYARLEPIADKYEQIALHQVAQENANGIDTPVREGYVPHYQDLEEQELFGGSQAGSATGFRKMRTYDTFADSIANGVDPKSINAVDLLQKRLSSGQKSINYRSWIDSLKQTIDPASGDPIATKVSIVKRPDGSSYLQVPKGYHQETLAGQRVAIKDGYEGIIGALTDPSVWHKNMVGQTIQKTSALGKSITLGLDTYHLGRIAIWNSLIKSLGIRTFEPPIPSYRKGATLLDQTLPELQKMIANGEIPKSYAKGILENKRLLNLAVKTGYNVGGISDALHQDWVHKIPGLGDFNSWLFNSFQRGAMAESWLLEFQRYRMAYPKLSENEVARMVSKDLNTRYGNLGRQGVLKSKTAQDTARFLFLAPQWNEGLIRTEIGALGQSGQALLDAVTGKRLFAGVLARSVGGMMAAQFIANQLINYATRGTPTWENPEEGIGAKLSAYIPDLIGNGPGFFLNPMSLAMETTHLLMKGYERTGSALETAKNYFRSRSSTTMRPVWSALTNKNALGSNYAPGQIWQGMLQETIPMPIAAGAIYSSAKQAMTGEPSEQFAGQYQKQLFSTFGIKLDQAPSDESRMYTLMNHFKLDNKIEDRSAGYNSPYSELNHALMIGNQTNAKNAMTKLMETRSPDQIEKYYKNTYPSMRMLESKRQMRDFLETLTEEQRSVYDRAKEKRKDTARSALDLLREMK